MYSFKPVMQMLEKDEFTLKGAGGEISFNTVIQDRTVLPEHVPVNNAIYKSLCHVTVFLKRRVSQSGAWMSSKVQKAELKKSLGVFLKMVYVVIMNAHLRCRFLFAESVAAGALCGARRGRGEVRSSQLAAAWSTHSYRFSTPPRPYCCDKHKYVGQY